MPQFVGTPSATIVAGRDREHGRRGDARARSLTRRRSCVSPTPSRGLDHMKNPFLVGDKIYLRPLEPSDAAAMATWMNDRDVTRTLQMYRPMNEVNERAFVERVSRSDDQIALA